MTFPFTNWDNIDWRKNNSHLAEELGITRQAVWQKRKRMKAPKATFKNRRSEKAKKKDEALAKVDTMTMTIKEIAAYLGTTDANARSTLKSRGLSYRKLYGMGSRKYKWKYPWNTVDWAMRNVDIAEAIGADRAVVAVTRGRLKKAGKLKGERLKIRFSFANVYVGEGIVSKVALDSEMEAPARHQKAIRCWDVRWDGKAPKGDDAYGGMKRWAEVYPHEIIKVLEHIPLVDANPDGSAGVQS